MDKEFLKPVRTVVIIFLILGSLFLAAKSIAALKSLGGRSSGDISSRPVITVKGTGEAFQVPDVATFSFTVTEKADSVAVAQQKRDDRISKVYDYLKKSGIEEKDIKTVGYNVNPVYENQQITCIRYPCPPGKQIITGYEASETFDVKVKKTDKAGEILGGVGGLGVQNISGLSLTIDDDTKIKDDARAMAIKDAQKKAHILARDLGVRLVGIVSFNENTNEPYYYGRESLANGKAVDQAAPTIAPGENKITSEVVITYEIR
jgi:uncharacterized protein YggE